MFDNPEKFFPKKWLKILILIFIILLIKKISFIFSLNYDLFSFQLSNKNEI